jgi:Spy/CpxP family protein refolding chaperone
MPSWSGKQNYVRERKAMADLIAIGYPDEATAEAAADEARRLAQT